MEGAESLSLGVRNSLFARLCFCNGALFPVHPNADYILVQQKFSDAAFSL